MVKSTTHKLGEVIHPKAVKLEETSISKQHTSRAETSGRPDDLYTPSNGAKPSSPPQKRSHTSSVAFLTSFRTKKSTRKRDPLRLLKSKKTLLAAQLLQANVAGPRICAIKGKRSKRTASVGTFVEYLVQWETSRGKLQWVSQKILENEHMCSSQAKSFLLKYENRARLDREEKVEKMQQNAAKMIQNAFQSYICRRNFKRLRFAVLRLQCLYRGDRGRLSARRQALLIKRKQEKLRSFERRSDVEPIGEMGFGDISSVLRDAFLSVINDGKYCWHEKPSLMWSCQYCSYSNEARKERCDLCLRVPSSSNKLLQLSKQSHAKPMKVSIANYQK